MKALFKEIDRLVEITNKHQEYFSIENRIKDIAIDVLQRKNYDLSKSKGQKLLNQVIKTINEN